MLLAGMNPDEIARHFGISRRTVRRIRKEDGQRGSPAQRGQEIIRMLPLRTTKELQQPSEQPFQLSPLSFQLSLTACCQEIPLAPPSSRYVPLASDEALLVEAVKAWIQSTMLEDEGAPAGRRRRASSSPLWRPGPKGWMFAGGGARKLHRHPIPSCSF